MNFTVVKNPNEIDLEKLSKMYAATSLGERPLSKLAAAIKNSAKVVVLESEGEYLGAGRTLSDGIYTLIVDLAIVSSTKRRGFGKVILTELLEGEEKNFVYLNSTWEAEPFYQKHGFKKQKTGYARYPFPSDYLE